MKIYEGMEIELHAFLSSALDGGGGVGGQLNASAAFSLRYPLDRRLGVPQSWSGCCGEEKNPSLYRVPNPGSPIRGLVTILTELSRRKERNIC
jgi:hypothetical protein